MPYKPSEINQEDIPVGVLPMLVERMVQIDDLKALETNTLEMWRAMTRYELQKESEVREAEQRERETLNQLQHQNDLLRHELDIRNSICGGCVDPRRPQQSQCCCACTAHTFFLPTGNR